MHPPILALKVGAPCGLVSPAPVSNIQSMRSNTVNSRARVSTRPIANQYGQNQALLAYYKCPEEFGEIEPPKELSGEEGFFQFGPGNLCYGRCEGAKVASRASGQLFDVRGAVEIDGGLVRFPFGLTEVVDNLRTERYARLGGASTSLDMFNRLKHDLYYSLRPLMPVSLRRHLQRVQLRGWNRLQFPQWPVDRTVDTILESALMLCMRAKDISAVPFIWFWPDGAPSCAMMTHDVETDAGLAFCQKLMALDDSFGIKSSFQLVPEGRYAIPRELLVELRGRGFEANVQDLNHDGDLFKDREEFLRRAGHINQYLRQFDAKGFRSAIMYRNAEWLDAIEASYDMSFPNVAHLEPQRGGCCTVMPYFIGAILELPLTAIQDYSLLHILGESSMNIWKRQIELIREKNGLMSFIVHPDYLTGECEVALYKFLLNHLAQLRAQDGVWIALPGEIDKWWRARGEMELVFRNGEWCVEGAGSERARIGYATLTGDRISYTYRPS